MSLAKLKQQALQNFACFSYQLQPGRLCIFRYDHRVLSYSYDNQTDSSRSCTIGTFFLPYSSFQGLRQFQP
jgi:hypothetical protein